MSIPFVRDIKFEYGVVEQLSPLIRRVIANNPGAFTYTGTGVYIIGHGSVAVIDPGPDLDEHFEALKAILKDEDISHILVTHSHMDHSPLAHPLAKWERGRHEGSSVKVHGQSAGRPSESEVRMEAGDDMTFRPDEEVSDGQVFEGEGWTMEAITTPGHTSNHVAYALKEEDALFSGDHVMGWSTTVISPPDGNMNDYYDSLEKVRDRRFETIWPTHGPPIKDTYNFVQSYLDHRLAREAAILDRLKAGDTKIPKMVEVIYAEIDKGLHPAACHSVLGHMIKFVEDGVVKVEGSPGVSATYSLA